MHKCVRQCACSFASLHARRTQARVRALLQGQPCLMLPPLPSPHPSALPVSAHPAVRMHPRRPRSPTCARFHPAVAALHTAAHALKPALPCHHSRTHPGVAALHSWSRRIARGLHGAVASWTAGLLLGMIPRPALHGLQPHSAAAGQERTHIHTCARLSTLPQVQASGAQAREQSLPQGVKRADAWSIGSARSAWSGLTRSHKAACGTATR